MTDGGFEALVRDHLPLVRLIAYDLGRTLPSYVDRDDLAGAGMLGLVQAARSYDPTRGPFVGYARVRIRGEMVDELRRSMWGGRSTVWRDAREAGLEVPAQDQQVLCLDDLAVDLPGAAPGPEALAVAGDERRRVLAAVEKLPERPRRVVTAAYLQGRLLADIAGELGITVSGAAWLQRTALGRLHAILAAADPDLPPRRRTKTRWLRKTVAVCLTH